ncbi:MAG: VOC family protein [Bacteroidia bacterium]
MSAKAIYVNLPVADLARSRAFWEALGFAFNDQFSDDKALCLVLAEGTIYSMLISPAFFATFTHRPIADGTTTQVLVAIEVATRERVDEIVAAALAHGGRRYREATDHGWMYYDSFEDPDGHQWEVMYTAAAPEA